MPSYQVAVCGPADCTDDEARTAYQLGELLAQRGVTVLCGGHGGVMAAVASGARAAGGLVVGILPDAGRENAAPDLSAALATNMGQARNAILVWSADAVIVVGGSWGTLSEQAMAMRRGVPVVGLGAWQVVDARGEPVPGPRQASTAAEAVGLALAN
jgi:uncharacterized protein (TIGR00725 family)